MFHFGDPRVTAKFFMDQAVATPKTPGMPDIPYEEMDEENLRLALAYIRMSYERARHEQMPEDVLAILVSDYDLVFERLAQISESFVEFVKSKKHATLGKHNKENLDKYNRLAGLA